MMTKKKTTLQDIEIDQCSEPLLVLEPVAVSLEESSTSSSLSTRVDSKSVSQRDAKVEELLKEIQSLKVRVELQAEEIHKLKNENTELKEKLNSQCNS